MMVLEDKVSIYILTHKKISEPYDETLYVPLLNGSALLDEDFGYTRDDTGENVSKLNPYLAELTGEYWVWKNSKSDIIGFCHYRRWFVKNIFMKKITKEDVINSLKEYDIILPQKTRLNKPEIDLITETLEENPDYGASLEDYKILENYLKENQPNYYDNYKKIMNGKEAYFNTIFIADKKTADNYFSWLFSIFNDLKSEIDFESHAPNNKRVFAFFCEILLSVYVKTNKLKIKEYYLHYTERKIPLLYIINKRFPPVGKLETYVEKILNIFKN